MTSISHLPQQGSTSDLLHDMYGSLPYLEAFIGRHVAEHGQEFAPAKRPKGIHKGHDRRCFYNAQGRVLWSNSELYRGAQYVEGFACSQNSPNFPFHHGWLTFDGVYAVDVTWRTPGTRYLGIVFETKALARRVRETGEVGAMLSDMLRPTVERYRHAAEVHLKKFNDLHPVLPRAEISRPYFFCGE